MQRNSQFVEINRVLRILVGKLLVDLRGLPIFLARHIQVRLLLFGEVWTHDDGRGLRGRGRLRLRRMRGDRWGGRGTRAVYEGLGLRRRGNAKAEEENACWKRHRGPDHGESPFSGLGLTLSGSFFLPPKIPNIFCKGFFFLSPFSADGSPGCPVASGGRLGSDFITGCPLASGVLGCPPKICDSTEPTTVPCPPCSSQKSVGAEPATYTSSRVVGQLGVASCKDSGSITTDCTPSGMVKSFTSR